MARERTVADATIRELHDGLRGLRVEWIRAEGEALTVDLFKDGSFQIYTVALTEPLDAALAAIRAFALAKAPS